MGNHQHLSGIREKDKNGFISNNLATLFKKKYLDDIFTFLCIQSVRNYQKQGSIYDFDTIKVFNIKSRM